MNHRIKIWPQYFERVSARTKTFEVRVNDRCYQSGDTVTLCRFDPITSKYTGEELTFKIGFVLPVDENRVAFSLLEKGEG